MEFRIEAKRPHEVFHVVLYHKYDEKVLNNGLKWFQSKQNFQNCLNNTLSRLYQRSKTIIMLKWNVVYKKLLFSSSFPSFPITMLKS